MKVAVLAGVIVAAVVADPSGVRAAAGSSVDSPTISPLGVQIVIDGELAIGDIERTYYEAVIRVGGDTADRVTGALVDVGKLAGQTGWRLVAVMGGRLGLPPQAMIKANDATSIVAPGAPLPDGRVLVSVETRQCGVVGV